MGWGPDLHDEDRWVDFNHDRPHREAEYRWWCRVNMLDPEDLATMVAYEDATVRAMPPQEAAVWRARGYAVGVG